MGCDGAARLGADLGAIRRSTANPSNAPRYLSCQYITGPSFVKYFFFRRDTFSVTQYIATICGCIDGARYRGPSHSPEPPVNDSRRPRIIFGLLEEDYGADFGSGLLTVGAGGLPALGTLGPEAVEDLAVLAATGTAWVPPPEGDAGASSLRGPRKTATRTTPSATRAAPPTQRPVTRALRPGGSGFGTMKRR